MTDPVTILQAYHNDPVQKTKYVKIIEKAVAEGRLVSGKYWCESDCSGCLVGQISLTEETPHIKFARDIDCPEWVPHLLDTLFEGVSDDQRQQFAVDVIKSIPVGFSDWQSMYHRLCVFMLENVCKNTDHATVRHAIADIISLHKSEEVDRQKCSAASDFAARSAESAGSAARSASESAASESAWSAAESAAGSAWSVSESAWSAARSAESAAGSAWSASESAAYQKIANETIRLFKEGHDS